MGNVCNAKGLFSLTFLAPKKSYERVYNSAQGILSVTDFNCKSIFLVYPKPSILRHKLRILPSTIRRLI